MMSNAMNSIAYERAALMREVELISENVKDSQLQEAFLVYENCDSHNRLYSESDIVSDEETEAIVDAIERIPDDDTTEEEISRIVNSTSDQVSLDTMLGISDEDDPTEEEEINAFLAMCDEDDIEECCK